jgi:hypothetical protein
MYSGPIHQRAITIKTFEIDDDSLVIEGTLIDDRLCKTFIYLLSQIVDPKTVHHIIVRMGLSVPDLIIRSINTDMHEVPHEACRDLIHVGDKLVGVSLTQGFNKNIKQVLGGINGCLHLYNLLLSMRSAAFQGFFAYCSRVQEDGSLRQPYFDESLIMNSCHVWSESGPFAPLLEKMKNASKRRQTEKMNPAD